MHRNKYQKMPKLAQKAIKDDISLRYPTLKSSKNAIFIRSKINFGNKTAKSLFM